MQPKQYSAVRPLFAAVVLAISTPAAFAATTPTPTQLPGLGYVVQGTSVSSTVTGSTLTITPGTTAAVVIQWGGSKPAATSTASTINPSGTAGFNIGSQATVNFSGTAGPVLNIDATGNPSMILGTMTAPSSFAGPVYVANANGIVVGSSAVITLPAGLGLINADLTSSKAQAVFTAAGAVPISFEGATGGVTVSAGADLSGVSTSFLLVAGAGNVNVAGAFVSNGGSLSYGIPTAASVIIDAGVGGYFSGSAFIPQDKGTAQTFGSLSTSNYNVVTDGFVYQDAPGSTVNLNLGTTSSPYSATQLNVLADGNINLASGGDLTNVTQGTLNWAGTLTNNGVLDYGDQSGSTLIPTANLATLSALGNIYNNTTTAQYGGIVNATSGIINAGSLTASGASFSNAGILQLGQTTSSVPNLQIVATQGYINLGGTVDVVSADNYTGSLYLSSLFLSAVSTAGQTVTLNTNPLLVSGSDNFAKILATNVNVDSSLTVSGGDFSFYPYSVDQTSAAPVSGSFVIASGATLSATDILLGNDYYYYPGEHVSDKGPAYTSYQINGSLVAMGTKSSPGSVVFGRGSTNIDGTEVGSVSPFNVNGSGSITAGNLTFNQLLGSVNNITTGQILANGFQVNAPSGGTVNITVSAKGSAPQGFNLKVNGNATVNSGLTEAVQTQTPAANSTYTQYLYPANANSNFVVQASGNMTVNAGSGSNNYNISTDSQFFQWPGLVYVQSNGGSVTVTAPIANAYAAQAVTGHAGVFLIANDITDNNAIYTNGNAGVVFAAPYSASAGIYPYASTINGINPTLANPSFPMVYFATPNPTVANANFSLQPLVPYFTNEYGYQQENQTFLTLP